jgi:hypothetical protein
MLVYALVPTFLTLFSLLTYPNAYIKESPTYPYLA